MNVSGKDFESGSRNAHRPHLVLVRGDAAEATPRERPHGDGGAAGSPGPDSPPQARTPRMLAETSSGTPRLPLFGPLAHLRRRFAQARAERRERAALRRLAGWERASPAAGKLRASAKDDRSGPPRDYREAVGFVALVAVIAALVTALATRGGTGTRPVKTAPRLGAAAFAPVTPPMVPAAQEWSGVSLSTVPVSGADPTPEIPPAVAITLADEASPLSLKLSGDLSMLPRARRIPTVVARPVLVQALPSQVPGETPADAAPKGPAVSSGPVIIDKTDRDATAEGRADTLFRMGAEAYRAGDLREAESRFREALLLVPAHVPVRQALAGLLLRLQRTVELEETLLDGLRHAPGHAPFAVAVARLQAERGDSAGAVATLERARTAGETNGEFLALHAAMLQRLGRHAESAARYAAAIALGDPKAIWFVGQGISLRELGRHQEARARFRRALDSANLPPELRSYVQGQLGS